MRLNRSTPNFLFFLAVILQGASHYCVYGGIVPITIQARNFTVGVVANDIGVCDAVGLTFRYEARDIRRHSAAKQRLHYYDVSFGLDHLIYFNSKIRHGLQQASPDLLKAAAKRHDTLFAIRKVSPLRAVSAKREHGIDIMLVVGGEKHLGDRFIVLHINFSCKVSMGTSPLT